MTTLRNLNRAVQSYTYPSVEFAQAVREMLNEVAERMEPASEVAKVECENCGEDVCRELEHQFHKSFEHGERWTCKPAQPDTSTVDVGMQCLGCGDTEPTCRCEGYSPEPVAAEGRWSINTVAGETFANWGKPAPAVAMTEELEVVLRLSAQHVEGWRQTYQSPEYRKQMLSAIAAVRAQAAEAGKVRMPKVRELLRSLVMECKLANSNPLSANVNPYILAPKLDAALAELDAVEGRK